MNVYLTPDNWLGIGIKRVAVALARTKPEDVTIVNDPKAADLTILHVVGHGGWTPADLDRNVAVIQYCLQTSEDPRPEAWLPLWKHAKAVWSYYDLDLWLRERNAFGGDLSLDASKVVNFYHAPLGVDGSVFQNHRLARNFTIGTSGYVAWSESVDECAAAVKAVDGRMFHLGPDLRLGSHVESHTGIPDPTLAVFYSKCRRVSGLRRVEGFELPVLEGLCAGARPVVFDAPHYRHWYGEHAEYVPEVAPDQLVPILTDLFNTEPRPVSADERAHIVETFDWNKLARGFWERVR